MPLRQTWLFRVPHAVYVKKRNQLSAVYLLTSETGHQQSSASGKWMSTYGAEAAVIGLKADIGFLRSTIAGKADVDLAGDDFRS